MRLLIVFTFITTVVPVAVTAPASAQPSGSIELIAQSSWVDSGGIFNAQVRVAGASPDSSVRIRVFPAWEERSAFLRGDVDESAPLLELDPIALGDLQDTSNEVLSLELDVIRDFRQSSIEEPIDRPTLATSEASGVYPLDIALISPNGDVQDSILTTIIQLPPASRNSALATSIILESQVGPSIQPDGTSTISQAEVAELSVLVNAIAAHPNADVALSITAETLLALERSDLPESAEILSMMRQDFSSDQLLPRPFAEVEEQAWIDADLADELAELYQLNVNATSVLTGLEPQRSVMLLDRTVTDVGLGILADQGVEGVVVRPAQVSSLDPQLFPEALTTRYIIPTPADEPVSAMTADGALANHFTGPANPTLQANRLLADLTLLSLQSSTAGQGVVVNPPESWIPNESFLNVFLGGLERIPALEGASPREVLSTTAFTPAQGLGTLGPPLERRLEPRREATGLRSYRTEFSQAQLAISSWATVIESDAQSVDKLEELLVLSANVNHSDTERLAFIDEVYRLIDLQKDNAVTTPETETITLTGRRSDISIVVNNNLAIETSVVLVLDSEKLAFPQGREVDAVLAPGSNRIEVAIEARASGDSPIRIQVFSPDRSILLGSSELLVRTFAFSGLGVLIGVAAIAVLLLWWLRHRRSTTNTIDVLPAQHDPTHPGEPIGV